MVCLNPTPCYRSLQGVLELTSQELTDKERHDTLEGPWGRKQLVWRPQKCLAQEVGVEWKAGWKSNVRSFGSQQSTPKLPLWIDRTLLQGNFSVWGTSHELGSAFSKHCYHIRPTHHTPAPHPYTSTTTLLTTGLQENGKAHLSVLALPPFTLHSL